VKLFIFGKRDKEFDLGNGEKGLKNLKRGGTSRLSYPMLQK